MRAPLDKVERIFHEAAAIPPSDRHEFLKIACGEDVDLLREVESLLAQDGETFDFEAAARRAISGVLSEGPVEPDSLLGSMLGPYRLDRKLGAGGMGAVYLATDTRLARQVAIKVINRALAQTKEAQARFLREARAAAALSHPNIAAVYDFGQTAQTDWLVMEYVEGRPILSDTPNPLSEGAWLRYATEIAAALAHAHARSLIHCDIKPPNILITSDDRVKIIDFGLARASLDQTAITSSITAPGTFVGTLAYSAPEILQGGAASARSDVYSLGVVLYEMACGEQPFSGLAGHQLISAVLMGSYPPLRARHASVKPYVEEIVQCCMSREPAMRYRDGAAILEALAASKDARPQLRTDMARPAIAILDFRSIGGASDLDWLGTGIAETLAADLARLKSVRVVSRSRVAQALRGLGEKLDPSNVAGEIGSALGARWVVTGAYQLLGERIRLTAALTEAASGDVLVTKKIDGYRTHLFELQDQTVAAILDALTIQADLSEQQKTLHAETRHLAAYEQYARGRQRISQMQSTSLATAIHHFGQAVTLDPDYALAYSGLGTAHALQFIATTNPEDIKLASGYLERAIELDPELGEPYPWLANIRIRKNDPAGAFLAGEKGVELQPDLAEAHYFYAGLHYMLPEFRPGSVRLAPAHYAEAIRLQPRFHAAWVVSGAVAAFLGKHAAAVRILNEAVRLENQPELLFRFVGPRTLLAIAHTRAGSWEDARSQHLRSIEELRSIDHVYADTFTALSLCGLGDIDIRLGDPHAALSYYRRARRSIRESRRILGGARLAVRADIGLAAAYAATGNTSRARTLIATTASDLEGFAKQTITTTLECSIPQLWLLLAAAELRLGDVEAAAAHLEKARLTGWLDLAWLKTDPELEALRSHSAFNLFVAELAGVPEAVFPMPRFVANGGELEDQFMSATT